uniref:Uncharacterized protein n=1 Tax=Triticum urartu TaxID=4572 RepID=A0A8R7R4J8_TRIUA
MGRETHRRPPRGDPLARPRQVALPLQVRLQLLAEPHRAPRPPQKAPPNPSRLHLHQERCGGVVSGIIFPLHQSLGEMPRSDKHVFCLPAQSLACQSVGLLQRPPPLPPLRC